MTTEVRVAEKIQRIQETTEVLAKILMTTEMVEKILTTEVTAKIQVTAEVVVAEVHRMVLAPHLLFSRLAAHRVL